MEGQQVRAGVWASWSMNNPVCFFFTLSIFFYLPQILWTSTLAASNDLAPSPDPWDRSQHVLGPVGWGCIIFSQFLVWTPVLPLMLGLGMCSLDTFWTEPASPSPKNLSGLCIATIVQQMVFVLLLNSHFLKEKGVFGKKKFQLKLLLSSAPVRCHLLFSLHPKAEWD